MTTYKHPSKGSLPQSIPTKPDLPALLQAKHPKPKTNSTKPKMRAPMPSDYLESDGKTKKRNENSIPPSDGKSKSEQGLNGLQSNGNLTHDQLKSIVDALSSSNGTRKYAATKQLKAYVDSAEKARGVLGLLPSGDHPAVSVALVREHCIKFIRKDF